MNGKGPPLGRGRRGAGAREAGTGAGAQILHQCRGGLRLGALRLLPAPPPPLLPLPCLFPLEGRAESEGESRRQSGEAPWGTQLMSNLGGGWVGCSVLGLLALSAQEVLS